jgi:hypothetical protein
MRYIATETLAKPCRCKEPLRDQDTCALCGRVLPAALEPKRQRQRAEPGNPWTRAGVIRALRAFSFFRGRPPMRTDWNERMGKDWPPLLVVERLFGSVPEAVHAASLTRAATNDRRPARAEALAG